MLARKPFSPDLLNQVTSLGESQGRDFANGKPVISPKGAMYQMQVMPSTAANPGYGVKPAANNTPAEYNRVGRDYRQTMLQRYGGDLSKMWGAYNMGPGALDSALNRFGGSWLQHAPQETRDYIMRNFRMLGR